MKGSRYKYDKLYPDWLDKLNWFIVSYRICGNTIMLNDKAKVVALPFDDRIYMHDWWVVLMTLKMGGVVCNLKKSTILYRQHRQQVVGLKSFNSIEKKEDGKISNFLIRLKGNFYQYSLLNEWVGISFSNYIFHKLVFWIYRLLEKRG